MATLKGHNSGIVEDTCKLFVPNRGFSVSAKCSQRLCICTLRVVLWRFVSLFLTLSLTYSRDVCLSVRPSVHHTLVLYQNELS